jgi:hypothetical protein
MAEEVERAKLARSRQRRDSLVQRRASKLASRARVQLGPGTRLVPVMPDSLATGPPWAAATLASAARAVTSPIRAPDEDVGGDAAAVADGGGAAIPETGTPPGTARLWARAAHSVGARGRSASPPGRSPAGAWSGDGSGGRRRAVLRRHSQTRSHTLAEAVARLQREPEVSPDAHVRALEATAAAAAAAAAATTAATTLALERHAHTLEPQIVDSLEAAEALAVARLVAAQGAARAAAAAVAAHAAAAARREAVCGDRVTAAALARRDAAAARAEADAERAHELKFKEKLAADARAATEGVRAVRVATRAAARRSKRAATAVVKALASAGAAESRSIARRASEAREIAAARIAASAARAVVARAGALASRDKAAKEHEVRPGLCLPARRCCCCVCVTICVRASQGRVADLWAIIGPPAAAPPRATQRLRFV